VSTRGAGSTAPALAVVGAAIASVLPGWAHVPIVLYDPIGRAVRVARMGAPGGPAIEMSYYGVYLLALIGALVGAAIGRMLERRDTWRSWPLANAWAATALGIAASYEVWSIWP